MSTQPMRNHEQSMGLWLNEPMVLNPALVDRALDELVDAGVEIIRIFLRNTNFTHRSPEIVALVERAVTRAHGRGQRVVLDCEPHQVVCREMGRMFPRAMASKLVRAVAKVCDGHLRLRVDTPSSAGTRPIYDGIEGAWLLEAGARRLVTPAFRVRQEESFYRDGGLHQELTYTEGVAVDHRKTVELRAEFPGVAEGELVIYVRFAVSTLPDFWAAEFHQYYEELLSCYRHIPLDGVGWDEPAMEGDWKSYRYGRALAEAFAKINGYALAEKLYLLDEPGLTEEAVRVRLDYYRTLNEGLAQAQDRFIERAREMFGPGLLLGTHHTWQGEGGSNDYRAGAVDYFRLNDHMDAGYTDCSWWDPPSVSYAYTLASSLGRLTASGEAEVNTWHFHPTPDSIRRNVNLMSLMNINWFNIWFGADSDCVRQQDHETWPESRAALRRHQGLQRVLGRMRPAATVAIWHGWEGVCGWNQPGLANAHKAFFLNTSDLLIRRSIAADFIDSRLLAESEIAAGCLTNRLGAYRALVIPYGLVLPRAAFAACEKLARAGGRVIFVGTPVARDEKGGSLAAEYAALLGLPEMTAESYLRGLDAVCALPMYRPQRLEVCRPLAEELPRGLVTSAGEVHGVRAADNASVFLTDLDPQQRLLDHLDGALADGLRVHDDHALWRLYRDDAGEVALVMVSADDRPLTGVIHWGEETLELTGGFAGVLARQHGKIIQKAGDLVWRDAHSSKR